MATQITKGTSKAAETPLSSVLVSPPDVAIDHLFPPYNMEKVQALNQWFDY